MSATSPVPVLFDGDCGLCQRTADLLRRWDHEKRLEIIPFAEARRRGLGTDLSEEEFESSFHAISEGRTLSGLEAIPVVLEQLWWGRVPAAAIRRVPPVRF